MVAAVATAAPAAKLKRVKGVEVFQAGTHRDHTYSTADLDSMIRNFEVLSDLFVPRVVIGHEEDQSFLENSGIPSAGVIERLWRDGDTLKADFADVPETIARLINGRAYRSVSAEVYDDYEHDGKGYGTTLRRVALLGGELPQIKTLNDLPLADYAERRGRRAVLRLRGRSPQPGGICRVYSEVQAVNRDEMLSLVTKFGVTDTIAQMMSDEILTDLVRVIQTQAAPQPGTVNAEGDANKDQAATPATPPVAAAVPPAPAAAPVAPTADLPAANPNVPVPNPQLTPSQVTVKYSEELNAAVKAAVAELLKPVQATLDSTKGDVEKFKEDVKREGIDARLGVLLKQGKVTPAAIDAGLRDQLYRADAVKKFSDGKTELDKQFAVLEAGPVVLKFNEQVKGGKPNPDTEKAAVEQHYEQFSEQFSRAGTSKETLVKGFEIQRKTQPRLTAKEYLGLAG